MTGAVPYLFLPGTARQALTFYRDVFGGDLTLNTLADFGRDDGPADAVAHGELSGPVSLFASDATGGDRTFHATGLAFSLLGSAPPATLRAWFDGLTVGATELDPLAVRPWGATDGQVVDRFGVRWLIGYEGTD